MRAGLGQDGKVAEGARDPYDASRCLDQEDVYVEGSRSCLLLKGKRQDLTPIVAIEPSETNGLRAASRIMVDKITTAPKARLGTRIGRLAGEDMTRLDRAILIFLGLAG